MDVRVRLLALALAALGAFTPSATAAPGDLDSSFSSDGKVTTLGSTDTFVPWAVAVQADGRIAIGGYSCDDGTCGPTGNSSFRLMRYTPDGGLDTDFGNGGTVTTAVGAGRSQAFDIVLEADGGIVAGGVASASQSDPGSFALVRYRSGGVLDERFGTGGRVITPVRNGDRFDAIADLVPQEGGGLVAARPAAAPFVSLPYTLRARRGRVRVRLRCLQSRRCRGTVSLTRPRSGRSSVLLARRNVSVPARRTRTYSLRLRRSLGPARRIRTRISFRGRDASGAVRSVSRRATLRH